ncbi:hypothetical protein P3T25_001357 [Paraburkholderia sp. GAS32]
MVIQQEMIEKNVVTCEKAITDCGKKALINARAPCRYVFEIAIVRVLSRYRSRAYPSKGTLQDWALSDNLGTLSAVFSSLISSMQRYATHVMKLDAALCGECHVQSHRSARKNVGYA